MNGLSNRGTYKVNRLLLNESGEVIKYIYENDEVKIKSPNERNLDEYNKYMKMVDDRDELSKIITEECGSFYFNFFNKGLDRIDIKDSIKVRFLYLCTYTNYEEKGMYVTYDNGVKMDRSGIESTLKLSTRESTNTISSLVDSGLIIKDGKHYMANKDYVYRGTIPNKIKSEVYSRVFDNGLRELYNNCDARHHKQLYYLFKLLPYVNTSCNAICQNPSESIIEDVVPLKLSEMCDVVGYDVSNAKKFEKELLKLHMFNQYAILGIINGKGTWYKINPRVLYAGSGDNLEEFKNLISTDFSVYK